MRNLHFVLLAVASSLVLTSCIKEDLNPAAGQLNDKAAIYVVRDAFRGSAINLSAEHLAGASFTSGTVISDKASGNIKPGSFVIQNTTVTSNTAFDLTTGIIIEMKDGADVPYVPGDSLLVNVIGGTLQRKEGRLVISGITADKITKVAENRPVFVRPVTLAMLAANFSFYESTLVSVHADVADYAAGVNYGGERQLNDNMGRAVLYTRNEAAFAGAAVPINAQFTGIAGYKNDGGNDTTGAKKTISLRSAADVAYSSGALYAGFPEGFESPDFSKKSSYDMPAISNNIDLATGNWKLQQAILGNTVLSDKFNQPGKQCIRMQQNLSAAGYVQMNFDLTQGASKVTVFYGKYSTDPTSTFKLEYSTNGGTTWVQAGSNISTMPAKGSTQATFMVNITGNVRFRINKLGLGASSATVQNGRLNIEDIAIYKK